MKIAIVKVFNSKNEMLFLLRAKKPFGWCFPGGKIDEKDLTSAAAASRELFEETGMYIHQDLLTYEMSSLTATGKEVDIFVARIDDEPKIKLSKSEHLNYRWMKEVTDDLILAGNARNFI